MAQAWARGHYVDEVALGSGQLVPSPNLPCSADFAALGAWSPSAQRLPESWMSMGPWETVVRSSVPPMRSQTPQNKTPTDQTSPCISPEAVASAAFSSVFLLQGTARATAQCQ